MLPPVWGLGAQGTFARGGRDGRPARKLPPAGGEARRAEVNGPVKAKQERRRTGARKAAAAERPRKDPFAGEGPMAQLKLEVARELGLEERVRASGWGGLTAAETGRLGGWMTRRLRQMQAGEERRGSGSPA
jgi:hypothetical protein